MKGPPTLACVALLVVLGSGCTRSFVLEEDGGPRRVDGGADSAVPGDGSVVLPTGKCEVPSAVDLLFVIDNSNSTLLEQEALAEQLPTLLDALLNPPDDDGDGVPDYPPIDDIHLGVVTADMGTGGFSIPTCIESNFGDDGVLNTVGNTGIAGCSASVPTFLTYQTPEDAREFALQATCSLVVGNGGCGFEQPLEAALKAVTPRSAPITFAAGSPGHGDGMNAGFLRPDSMLGVVVLTDEDDCSARDPEVFNPTSETAEGDLNLRCFSNPEMLHPVERYVDGFRSLRADRPDLLTFAAIVGVPPGLAPDGVTDAADIDRILSDERMEERLDPSMPSRLVASCNEVGGVGLAFPPRRVVGLARAFAGQSVVASLCEADWTESIRTIGRTMGRRACLEYGPD